MFGDFNPYSIEIEGDWLEKPYFENHRVHLGDVYINGVSTFEAKSIDDLYDDTPRTVGYVSEVRVDNLVISNPSHTLYKWYATVTEDTTTIFCNFREYDPNLETVEINVRPCCFYPKATGIGYITLRGFEIAHAACPWAPPTSHQMGMVGPHFSRGWIIENNHLHDAKCCGISIGKEESTGHNLYTRFGRKSAHRHQLEAVFSALRNGWSRDTVGSHIIRNNEIHDCGQTGIVGHLGCVFSTIEHNHIYNIGIKHEFFGHEMGGIKLHAAIDVTIRGNNIHNCDTYGTWLDWEAQGCRVTGNLYYANSPDLMLEVSHGPHLIDHNVMLSKFALINWAQGSAFVHNLICGKVFEKEVLERQTPYHFPHSTMVAGYSHTYGGDDRYYNNIFVGNVDNNTGLEYLWGEHRSEGYPQFTTFCDKFSDPKKFEDAIASFPKDQFNKFFKIPQPVWLKDNVYAGNAKPSIHEKNAITADNMTVDISENNGVWKLNLDIPAIFATAECEAVTTARLGEPRISAMPYETSDGLPVDLTRDIAGFIHGAHLYPGPLAVIKAGKQTVTVWEK
jgi:hypothetical protein